MYVKFTFGIWVDNVAMFDRALPFLREIKKSGHDIIVMVRSTKLIKTLKEKAEGEVLSYRVRTSSSVASEDTIDFWIHGD